MNAGRAHHQPPVQPAVQPPVLPQIPAHGLRVVTIARRWIGTPYQHQASCLGAGCDCLGLIRAIWRELYEVEPEQAPAYTMDWGETRAHELLWQAASRHLLAKPLAAPQVGDVLLFRMRHGCVAKHLGIQSRIESDTGAMQQHAGGEGDNQSGRQPGEQGGAAFIHAYSGRGVQEHALSPAWQRRIVARFSFPEELN